MELISKEDYTNILSDFLSEIEFEMPTWGYDHSLKQPVMVYFQNQLWPNHLKQKAVAMAEWMSTGLGMCYPFVDHETQIAIGIFATYVLFIDDLTPEMRDGIREFNYRFITHQPQKCAVLQSLVEFLPTFEPLFGLYANAMITKSTIEFLYGCLLEGTYDKNNLPPVGALNFPSYFRQKNGYAEPHAHFAFPQKLYPEEHEIRNFLPIIPDLCDFINHANDLLSFYKESITGKEQLNFICNYSTVQQISIPEALKLTSSSVAQNVHRIRKVLSGNCEMLDTTNKFMRGYVAWYLNQDRYKLPDLHLRDMKGVRIKRTD